MVPQAEETAQDSGPSTRRYWSWWTDPSPLNRNWARFDVAEVPHGVTCALGADPMGFDPAPDKVSHVTRSCSASGSNALTMRSPSSHDPYREFSNTTRAASHVSSSVRKGFSRTFDDSEPPTGTTAHVLWGVLRCSEPRKGHLHRKCGRTPQSRLLTLATVFGCRSGGPPKSQIGGSDESNAGALTLGHERGGCESSQA